MKAEVSWPGEARNVSVVSGGGWSEMVVGGEVSSWFLVDCAFCSSLAALLQDCTTKPCLLNSSESMS